MSIKFKFFERIVSQIKPTNTIRYSTATEVAAVIILSKNKYIHPIYLFLLSSSKRSSSSFLSDFNTAYTAVTAKRNTIKSTADKGYPEAGIAPETPWEEVPDDFECPLCGVDKDNFSEA